MVGWVGFTFFLYFHFLLLDRWVGCQILWKFWRKSGNPGIVGGWLALDTLLALPRRNVTSGIEKSHSNIFHHPPLVFQIYLLYEYYICEASNFIQLMWSQPLCFLFAKNSILRHISLLWLFCFNRTWCFAWVSPVFTARKTLSFRV